MAKVPRIIFTAQWPPNSPKANIWTIVYRSVSQLKYHRVTFTQHWEKIGTEMNWFQEIRPYNLLSTSNDSFDKLFLTSVFTPRVFARGLLRGNHHTKILFIFLFKFRLFELWPYCLVSPHTTRLQRLENVKKSTVISLLRKLEYLWNIFDYDFHYN